MVKQRKKYDKEFKERALELSKNRQNVSELAQELGIKPAQLHRWRKEAKEFGPGSLPGNGNGKQFPEQEQIPSLDKKLRDAELERDILKKGHRHLFQERSMIYRSNKNHETVYH